MIQVAFARGNDNKIHSATYEDGKIYISKDKFKIYTDYNNKRAELNPGVVANFTLDWGNNITTLDYTFTKIDLDLSLESNIVFVMGIDDNYFNEEVVCIKAVNNNTLTFERTGTGQVKTSGKIFAYAAANNTRAFEIISDDENVVTDTEVIEASNWTLNNEGNYESQININISDEDTILASSEHNSITNIESKENYILITSTQEPTNIVNIDLTVLPKNAIKPTKVLYTDKWENNTQEIAFDDINSESMLLINYSVETNISVVIENNKIIFKTDITPNENIEVNVIILDSIATNRSATLSADNWEVETGIGYKNTMTNMNLVCGPNGETAPLINCLNNANGYNYINNVLISSDKQTLIFYASEKPATDIEIQIIDFN